MNLASLSYTQSSSQLQCIIYNPLESQRGLSMYHTLVQDAKRRTAEFLVRRISMNTISKIWHVTRISNTRNAVAMLEFIVLWRLISNQRRTLKYLHYFRGVILSMIIMILVSPLTHVSWIYVATMVIVPFVPFGVQMKGLLVWMILVHIIGDIHNMTTILQIQYLTH